jgi:hypothetical protein
MFPPPIVFRQRLGKHVLAATNTDGACGIKYLVCSQRIVGDLFFPELVKYYSDQIKEVEIGGTCVTRGEMCEKFGSRNLKARDHLENLGG